MPPLSLPDLVQPVQSSSSSISPFLSASPGRTKKGPFLHPQSCHHSSPLGPASLPPRPCSVQSPWSSSSAPQDMRSVLPGSSTLQDRPHRLRGTPGFHPPAAQPPDSRRLHPLPRLPAGSRRRGSSCHCRCRPSSPQPLPPPLCLVQPSGPVLPPGLAIRGDTFNPPRGVREAGREDSGAGASTRHHRISKTGQVEGRRGRGGAGGDPGRTRKPCCRNSCWLTCRGACSHLVTTWVLFSQGG